MSKFSLIAVIVLLIACINFVNLTTARAADRAKEVGVRKVIGAAQTELAGQFIGESIFFCIIAFIITLGLTTLLIPEFNQLAGKTILSNVVEHPSYIAVLFASAVAVGLLAGLYPALVLSNTRLISILRSGFRITGAHGGLRSSLVVLQFAISLFLIITTMVILLVAMPIVGATYT